MEKGYRNELGRTGMYVLLYIRSLCVMGCSFPRQGFGYMFRFSTRPRSRESSDDRQPDIGGGAYRNLEPSEKGTFHDTYDQARAQHNKQKALRKQTWQLFICRGTVFAIPGRSCKLCVLKPHQYNVNRQPMTSSEAILMWSSNTSTLIPSNFPLKRVLLYSVIMRTALQEQRSKEREARFHQPSITRYLLPVQYRIR